MDSKKRRIETRVWDKPFFSELAQIEKLFYWFVITKCDNVGVYQHNKKLAEFHCEGEIQLKEFTIKLSSNEYPVIFLDESTIWLKYFVRDTWGTLVANNNLGTSCYKLLLKHNLLERFITECPNCINISSFKKSDEFSLPQIRGSSGPKALIEGNSQGQGRGSPDSINITINSNISNILIKKFKKVSRKAGKDISEIALESEISKAVEVLNKKGVEDPKSFIVEKADSLIQNYKEDIVEEKEIDIERFLKNVCLETYDNLPF